VSNATGSEKTGEKGNAGRDTPAVCTKGRQLAAFFLPETVKADQNIQKGADQMPKAKQQKGR